MSIRFRAGATMLLFAFALTFFPVTTYAANEDTVDTYRYEEDLGNGFTAETILMIDPVQGRSGQKSAYKQKIIRHSGRQIASVTLDATFSYNGTTSSVVSYRYEKDMSFGWLYTRHNIVTSGGRVTLTADLVSAIGTVPISISMYCTPAGVIS